jgi:hypothetical protein
MGRRLKFGGKDSFPLPLLPSFFLLTADWTKMLGCVILLIRTQDGGTSNLSTVPLPLRRRNESVGWLFAHQILKILLFGQALLLEFSQLKVLTILSQGGEFSVKGGK